MPPVDDALDWDAHSAAPTEALGDDAPPRGIKKKTKSSAQKKARAPVAPVAPVAPENATNDAALTA